MACGVIVLVVILLTEFKDMDFDLRDDDDGRVGMGMAPHRSNPSYVKDDGGEIQRGNYPRQLPKLESGADLTNF